MAEYQRYISQRVLTDQLPITYKLISRNFNLHVNDSKKILYTFFENNRDSCTATYIITGLVDSKKQIRFTNDLNTKSQFDSVSSMQVYSVKPSKNVISLNDIITSVNDDLSPYTPTSENCTKWGIIKCPTLIIQEEEDVKTATKPQSKKHDIKKDEPKPVKKQATDSSTKKDPFAISSLYKSRKKPQQEELAPAKQVSKEKPKYQYVSRKSSTQESSKKSAVKKLDSDLQALFDDDDDDFKDETFEEDKKKEDTPVEIESIEETPDDSVVQVEPIKDSKIAPETEVETEDTQDNQEEPEIDEDGYIVTKKKKQNKISKAAPPSKRHTTLKPITTSELTNTNKQKKQSSLMSFFGKR